MSLHYKNEWDVDCPEYVRFLVSIATYIEEWLRLYVE